MRFLCDEMLMRLARLLRAAGYDTLLAEGGAPDADLLRIARDDARILITRDRRLAAAAPGAHLIAAQGAAEEACELTRALGVDWTLAPFTRCVVDNAMLAAAEPEDLARMPAESRALPGPFRRCPACGRVYWPGSHVRRMSERLAALNAAGFGER